MIINPPYAHHDPGTPAREPTAAAPWHFGDAAPERPPASARGSYVTAPAYANAPGMAGEVSHLGPQVGETIGKYEVRVRDLPPGAMRPEWRLPARTRLSLLARLSIWTGRAWSTRLP